MGSLQVRDDHHAESTSPDNSNSLNAPRYFLSPKSLEARKHAMASKKDYIIGYVTKIESCVVTNAKKKDCNPYNLAEGTSYHECEIQSI